MGGVGVGVDICVVVDGIVVVEVCGGDEFVGEGIVGGCVV